MSYIRLPLLQNILDSIDNGSFFRKPFSLVYQIMAILNLFFPLYFFYEGIAGRIFNYSFSHGLWFILIWLGLVGIGIIGFLIWVNRSKNIGKVVHESDEFVATPVFAQFIQTFGEWLGIFITLFGFYSTLINLIFNLNAERLIPFSLFVETNPLSLIIMPVFGYLLIVTFRFLAEQIKALAAIANNTKK